MVELKQAYICDKCGLIVKADIKEGIYECGSCNNNTEINNSKNNIASNRYHPIKINHLTF